MIPYFQTTSFTTAAAALLTILHELNPKIELTKANEFDIWHKSVNLPTRGSSIYGLANYAQDYKPTVIVEAKEYDFPDYRFYRYKKEDIEQAEFSSQLHQHKIQNIIEKKVAFNELKTLVQNNLLLVRVNAKPIRNEKRNTSNYIVIHHYENGYFSIIDPAFTAFSIPETVLKEAYESLETKKYRSHKMLVFPRKGNV